MSFIDDFARNLFEEHDRMRQALAGLPQRALDWRTDHIRNSLAALTVHVCGSQTFWLGNVVAGQDLLRERASEFATAGLGETQLLARLGETEARTRSVLEALGDASLAERRVVDYGGQGAPATVGWVLGHVLKHTAYHAGQMVLIRKAWLDRQA